MEGHKESLEERLERIRLRNLEIEQKHREAEEDRIRALRDNAMVEVKSPKHEDWPKQHKNDTLYDNPDKDSSATPTPTPGSTGDVGGRKKKTFTEGDGPPPDPAYNFLADSERDGVEAKSPSSAAAADRKAPRTVNQNQDSAFRKNDSFRRQNSSSSSGTTSNSSVKSKNGGDYRKPMQYDAQPKKNLETNWRTQTRDNDVVSSEVVRPTNVESVAHVELGSSSITKSDVLPMRPIVGCSHAAPAPTVVRQPLPLTRPIPVEVVPAKDVAKELVVEQRGNIQISVSKDGEIQSVKLTSARTATPGTGRVGLPRAITKQSQPPPSPAQITQITSPVAPLPLNASPPLEALNPSNQFQIPNMAYPPPPLTKAADGKKFSVQDRLAKFQVPT